MSQPTQEWPSPTASTRPGAPYGIDPASPARCSPCAPPPEWLDRRFRDRNRAGAVCGLVIAPVLPRSCQPSFAARRNRRPWSSAERPHSKGEGSWLVRQGDRSRHRHRPEKCAECWLGDRLGQGQSPAESLPPDAPENVCAYTCRRRYSDYGSTRWSPEKSGYGPRWADEKGAHGRGNSSR